MATIRTAPPHPASLEDYSASALGLYPRGKFSVIDIVNGERYRRDLKRLERRAARQERA